jgi:S1-C subfamily serine protease
MGTIEEPGAISPAPEQGDGAGAGPDGATAGPDGPGAPEGHGNQRDGRGGRPWRRPALLAGASVGAAALVFAGLGTAEAMGATALTTSQIASTVDPGLVDVVSTLGYQDGAAAGTGMVLTSTGEVLTNNHVIDGATSIKATDVGNGRTYTAKVVGYDKTRDVAVLQLQGASGLATVTLSSTSPQTGQKVVALGNAGGKGGTPSVATGTVTGLHQTITASDESAGNAEQLNGLIGHNAAIQPGDSGGPLVNTSGQVIGMNTAASSSSSTAGFQSQDGQTPAPTQAFAIPITEASSIASQIEAGTPSSSVHLGGTAFLGLETSSSSDGTSGFGGSNDGGLGGNYGGGLGGYAGGGYGSYGGYNGDGGSTTSNGVTIAGVVPGSAADQAGLAAGDQITSVAGHSVTSSADIQSLLGKYHPGDRISISWTDQFGQSQTTTVTLTAGPAS